MPRALPLPLIMLCLLLAACALPVRDGMVLRAPQESPTAALQSIGSGKQAQNAPQASPEPSMAIPSPTEGPNVLATLQTGILWATQTERAYERAVAAQTATQQALVNSFAFASQTAQKPASTTTKAAQETETSLQVARITQSAFIVYATQNAPAQELDAAEKHAQANTALFRAMAGPLSILVLLVFATACLIYVIRNPRQGAAVEAELQEPDEFPELRKLNPAPQAEPYTPMVKRVIPAHVPEGVLIRFAQTVKTSHNTGGVPFSRAKWVDAGMMSRRSWDALMDFFSVHEYALKLGDADSSPMAFTPEGVRYLRGFENDPPTEGEYPISA